MQVLGAAWVGADPVWLVRHIASIAYQNSGRSAHELRCLAETFAMGGRYDQLNLLAMGCFELLARRWRLIRAAHSSKAASPGCKGTSKDWRSGVSA